MDSRLEWTQKLGDAFLAQQNDVMDSVQRLRREAQAAGNLVTNPKEVVTTEEETVVIEPASPETVYVPCYDPTLIYGVWPYPAYPPFYYPLPECYPEIGFGFGIVIVESLWGWEWWDWHHHRIYRDHRRYNAINRYDIEHHGRPTLTEDTWEHDPYHRRGVAYPTSETREEFQPAQVRRPEAGQAFRGFEQPGAAQVRGTAPPPSAAARPTAPIFEGFGTPRSDVRVHEQRGVESRGSMVPSRTPTGGAPSGAGPRGGGPHGGGSRGGPSGGARH